MTGKKNDTKLLQIQVTALDYSRMASVVDMLPRMADTRKYSVTSIGRILILRWLTMVEHMEPDQIAAILNEAQLYILHGNINETMQTPMSETTPPMPAAIPKPFVPPTTIFGGRAQVVSEPISRSLSDATLEEHHAVMDAAGAAEVREDFDTALKAGMKAQLTPEEYAKWEAKNYPELTTGGNNG